MQTTKVVDPVCGMDINISEAEGKSEFDGKQYYFCSQECQDKFENNPAQYMQSAEEGQE